MKQGQPQTVYLQDYQAPNYHTDKVDLTFELGKTATLVTSKTHYQRRADAADSSKAIPLELYGEQLELLEITCNEQALNDTDYEVTASSLILHRPPADFTLHLKTRIYPHKNTSLEGLYQSAGNFCTQCEAQGFRKITYYPDRPDMMAVFTTRIIADPEDCPVMLSNGNRIESGTLEDGRHWTVWHDPHCKPCYLFALVAGRLEHVEDYFNTQSGRSVTLQIYTEAHNIDKCEHAMQSLKRAMQWDEQRFGLEYDLDIYMIVAVDDFNMGAMENKGLNIFNSKLVFASPETATDADYINIEAVIGHEYFHNWTGNRVTCRDWFQLSLKEGLTVFRDQEFTADLHSPAVKRIEDVRMLRTHQFAEDSGPMAHPIRPASYMEINNFYTVTVYEKGAEVVRLYHTLLGREGFRKGMDLYVERHDGQAVTTEDFLKAMADANQVDLSQLQTWYDQAGTPCVRVRMEYDATQKRCTLHCKQSCPPTPEAHTKRPFLIPLAVSLLNPAGEAFPLQVSEGAIATEQVLKLTQQEQSFTFENIPQRPVPSLLRGFSAPVNLDYGYTEDELIFLIRHDNDDFNRWDASQRLAMQVMRQLLKALQNSEDLGLRHDFIDAIQGVLNNEKLDLALRAEALTLPSVSDAIETSRPADPVAIYQVRRFIYSTLAKALRIDLENIYRTLQDASGTYRLDTQSMGQRHLKNTCLTYLGYLQDESSAELAAAQYFQADNMTDAIAGLHVLMDIDGEQRQQALQHFHDRWQQDTVVMDKWFALQAASSLPNTPQQIKVLMKHPLFDMRNPNKVRALIGSFAMRNTVHFHAADGSGYHFLAEQVMALNAINPQMAARMVRPLMNWRHMEINRARLMKEKLELVLNHQGLSGDVYEIVSKSLTEAS